MQASLCHIPFFHSNLSWLVDKGHHAHPNLLEHDGKGGWRHPALVPGEHDHRKDQMSERLSSIIWHFSDD